MRKITFFQTVLIVGIILSAVSCSNKESEPNVKSKKIEQKISKTQKLINEIVTKGDYINSLNSPSLISAEEVNQLNDSNVLILDLRNGKEYSEGHIKNSVRLKFKELIDYFQVSGTPDYNKVVIVCYTGQMASYATSVLQLLGYDNVYAMNLGMCAWNKKFSKRRIKNATNRLADKLETKSNPKSSKGKLSEIKCKRNSGIEILRIRAKKIIKEGFKEAAVTIDDIISDPGDYYIVNYCKPDIYALGHLQSAIQFTPQKSLKFDTDLLTLPTDKTIVIYDFDGQNSAFVVAYLRMLGYNAKTLKYGATSFMNEIMLENSTIGHGFSEKSINNFKFETIPYVEEEGGVEEGGC